MDTIPFKLRVSQKMHHSMMLHDEIDWDAFINAEIKRTLQELKETQPLR